MRLNVMSSRNVVRLLAFMFTISVMQGFKSKNANAAVTAMDAITAVGLSAGAGALVGLSTTAFYTEPTKHMNNVLIGAGLGTIVGVGVATSMFLNADQEDEIDPEELLISPNKDLKKKSKDTDTEKDSGIKDGDSEKKTTGTEKKESSQHSPQFLRRQYKYTNLTNSAVLPITLVKNEWAVSMQVFNLRF